ncbi:tryptophan halogenase family protein [Roseateles sp.]|uniref:tryptophan halogenase family protein n=1 Tax=Roseateles sp. TaxID=1971397 RepID=UPI002F429D41
MQPIQDILIVGGGTAGWLTAAFLARQLGTAHGGVRITLVESSDIGIIGVGEGTFPSIRGTLSAIGIGEAEFLEACSATYKQGIRFEHWVRPPGAAGADHYFHPFSQPSQRPGAPELLPYWLMGDAGEGRAFAEAVTLQKAVADARHGPKRASDGDFLGPLNYAYHFDAGRFAALLAEHGQALGVKRVIATVDRVDLDEQGAIAAVHTKEAGTLTAGLYVDCSGFRARLIGEALGSPFKSMRDVLFVDSALAMQVPYARPDAPIASYTIASAQDHGWIWDIGLQERRGIGHVYSSRHCGDEEAERALRRYIGPASDALTPRKLALNIGYRETQWVKNCVAVGLSGGFLEPLESSGIGLIETAAYLIGQLFPFNGDTAPVAKHFNAFMNERYARIVDFIKLHYGLTQRTDTAFWRENADPASFTDTLKEKLAMWRCRPPQRLDFITDVEMYLPASWQYVLYGMEFETQLGTGAAALMRSEEARKEFATIAQLGAHALRDLPPHRMLIEQLLARTGKRAA